MFRKQYEAIARAVAATPMTPESRAILVEHLIDEIGRFNNAFAPGTFRRACNAGTTLPC